MYTPIQLEAIKLFGRKELTHWAIVHTQWDDFADVCIYLWDWKYYNTKHSFYTYESDNEMSAEWTEEEWFSVVGSIPHLEDLFRVAEEKGWIVKIAYNYLEQKYVGIEIDNSFGEDDIYALIPYSPSLPLLDQPNLEEIISLFK